MMMVEYKLINDHLIHWLPRVPFLELYIHRHVSKFFKIKKYYLTKKNKNKSCYTFFGDSEQSVSSISGSLAAEFVP